MITDEQFATVLSRLAEAERQLDILRALNDTEMGRSLLNKSPRIPWGTTVTGPTGVRYTMARIVTSGNLKLVAQPAATSTWSDG